MHGKAQCKLWMSSHVSHCFNSCLGFGNVVSFSVIVYIKIFFLTESVLLQRIISNVGLR